MWINTWLVLIGVVGWIVCSYVAAGLRLGWWTSAGAVALAIGLPPTLYPWSKSVMLRALHRLDPPG